MDHCFFFWNYPKGQIFLGDGVAYLIGFWVAFLSVLLVARNSSVSPIFALLVNAYPTVETLFTVWRRVFHKQKNPSIADDMHLHSLIYRRVVRWEDQDKGNIVSISANARTSPYLWAIHTITIIPACMFWDSTLIMSSVLLVFIFLYIYFFKKIIQFKVPSWLK
jgi:UDP-N-acetylmuramyl pentapeptide phosphotransferase/UDP-N-acetylglucosamine-1-phosphate transferase